MSEAAAEQAPVWWIVCCYQCAPLDILAGAAQLGVNGLVMPFGHIKEPGDYTTQAVEWVNAHGDDTGHTDIIMMTNCPIGVAQIPIPRHGLVALSRPQPGIKSIRITPLGADGKPNGEPVRIEGAGTVMMRRTVLAQGDPS